MRRWLKYRPPFQRRREIHPECGSYTQPVQNKWGQHQLDELVKEVAQEPGRIVCYLDKLGFRWDDHYQRYGRLLSTLTNLSRRYRDQSRVGLVPGR